MRRRTPPRRPMMMYEFRRRVWDWLEEEEEDPSEPREPDVDSSSELEDEEERKSLRRAWLRAAYSAAA